MAEKPPAKAPTPFEHGFWRTLWLTVAQHPISLFAVLCVMATAAFLGYVTLQLLGVLSSPEWCSKALQAERISPGNTFVGLTACVELLKLQVQAQASALLISISGYNLVLIVLVVVVVAGAKASFNANQSGISGSVGRDDGKPPIPVVIEQPRSQPVPTTDVPAKPKVEPEPDTPPPPVASDESRE